MQNPRVRLIHPDIISSIADGQLVVVFSLMLCPPSARVRMLNSTRSDIVLSARRCTECVHEGVKLLLIRERKHVPIESNWS